MPFLELLTNVALSREQSKDLAISLSNKASEALKKPVALIGVQIRADEILTFAGTHDPCFQLRVTSLGSQPDKNVDLSKTFTDFLNEKIAVENDRGYVVFFDPDYPNIGFKGTTAAKLWR